MLILGAPGKENIDFLVLREQKISIFGAPEREILIFGVREKKILIFGDLGSENIDFWCSGGTN